jgi:hypothetical protein
MSQKETLARSLEYATTNYYRNPEKVLAAKAFCVISWLHDMNWHGEADKMEAQALAAEDIKKDFKAFEANQVEAGKLHQIGSLLNHIFGWGLDHAGWKATGGDDLVAELWELIRQPS